ncbi:MAG: hypothetical protein KBH10_08210, partial [Laribacter sp.]|nr:hypothetical protein [Laribacter sp.]
FPSPRDARPLAGILLCGARTFLPPQAGGGCPADFGAHSSRFRGRQPGLLPLLQCGKQVSSLFAGLLP